MKHVRHSVVKMMDERRLSQLKKRRRMTTDVPKVKQPKTETSQEVVNTTEIIDKARELVEIASSNMTATWRASWKNFRDAAAVAPTPEKKKVDSLDLIEEQQK